MNFSHSLCSNFDIVRLNNNKNLVISRYHHIVFTGFCLYRSNNLWSSFDEGNKTPLFEWLRNRIDITSTSLRNLASSSIYKTTVYLLVDPSLPCDLEFKRLSSILFNYSSDIIKFRFLPIDTRKSQKKSLTEMYSTVVAPQLSRIIFNYISAFNVNVIASRLDSDDGFTNSHYLTLALAAESVLTNSNLSTYLLDFPVGYQYDFSSHMLYRTLWPEGNFSSIVYRAGSFVSVDDIISPFSYPHDIIPTSLPKITISTSACQWIQTIHGENVANHIYSWSSLLGCYEFKNIFNL